MRCILLIYNDIRVDGTNPKMSFRWGSTYKPPTLGMDCAIYSEVFNPMQARTSITSHQRLVPQEWDCAGGTACRNSIASGVCFEVGRTRFAHRFGSKMEDPVGKDSSVRENLAGQDQGQRYPVLRRRAMQSELERHRGTCGWGETALSQSAGGEFTECEIAE